MNIELRKQGDWYVATDELVHCFGEGFTEEAARHDHAAALTHYHATLLEHRANLSPRMARHLAALDAEQSG